MGGPLQQSPRARTSRAATDCQVMIASPRRRLFSCSAASDGRTSAWEQEGQQRGSLHAVSSAMPYTRLRTLERERQTVVPFQRQADGRIAGKRNARIAGRGCPFPSTRVLQGAALRILTASKRGPRLPRWAGSDTYRTCESDISEARQPPTSRCRRRR